MKALQFLTALLITAWVLFAFPARAQDKTATIQLAFTTADSSKVCTATVLSEEKPVAGVEVNFYVKRLYSLLPIKKGVETDENGMAAADFPLDLPGDKKGIYEVVVKIEENDDYGDVEARQTIQWGLPLSNEYDHWKDRSLSASRAKAPMYLILASNLIISVIWGTIVYVMFQFVRIKRSGQLAKK